MREEQLKQILFPLGEMTKEEVRKEAEKRKLKVAEKPDSQGICFVGEVSVAGFLKKMGVEEKPGKVFLKVPNSISQKPSKIQDPKSNYQELVEIGEHKGVWGYTIGQRFGFKIQDLRFKNNIQKELFDKAFDRTNMPPLYVVGKEVEQNRLVVGTREECYTREFEVEAVHFMNEESRNKNQEARNIHVRIRHQGKLIPAQIQNLKSRIMVRLDEPVFGVAPGQSAVFYDGDVCLGGGIIL